MRIETIQGHIELIRSRYPYEVGEEHINYLQARLDRLTKFSLSGVAKRYIKRMLIYLVCYRIIPKCMVERIFNFLNLKNL